MVAPARTFTIDTSVWVNGFVPTEPGHATSRAFLDRLLASGLPVIVPTLLRVELAGAIARKRHDRVASIEFAREITELPFVRLVPLTSALAERAATLAADRQLRGADAIYAAVAAEYQSELVSLDNEHLTRLTSIVHTLTPAQALLGM